MAIALKGVIHGKRIDLDWEVRLPDGTSVVVQIEPLALSLQEKQDLVRATSGAWANDPSVDEIFAALASARQIDPDRYIPTLRLEDWLP